MSSELLKHCSAQNAELRTQRSNWEIHWQDVARYILPSASDVYEEHSTKGDRRHQYIVDSTGEHANTLLAGGLHDLLTNPTTRWFALAWKDKLDNNAKAWLNEVEKTIYRELREPHVGFSAEMHSMYLNLCAFGTAAMFVGWNEKTNSLYFNNIPIKEVYIAQNEYNIVDVMYRVSEESSRQIYQKWPETCGTDIKKDVGLGKADNQQKHKVIHAVFPRNKIIKGLRTKQNKPYASVYYLEGAKEILQEGGFDTFPYIVPRWGKVASSEVYGRSPAMSALPHVKQLQEIKHTTLVAKQKVADPPLTATTDAVIGAVNLLPGGLTYMKPNGQIVPINTGANPLIVDAEVAAERAVIQQLFYNDMFSVRLSGNPTATEVNQRRTETLRQLTPFFGKLSGESSIPLINRIYSVLEDNFRIKPSPTSQPFDVVVDSAIALAQKTAQLDGLRNFMGFIGNFAQLAQAGEISQILKTDDVLREVAEMYGVNAALLNSKEELAALSQRQRPIVPTGEENA